MELPMSDNLKGLKFSYKEQVSRSILWGHYFIFLNILLSCLIGFAYVYAAPDTDSFISFFYLMVSWLGHMSFLTIVCYLVIFFPLAFIGNFRYYRVFSVIISVLIYTILLFDIKIFLLVKVHLGLPAINLIINELDFDTGLNYNFLFAAVPVVIIIESIFAKLTTHSLYKAHHPIFVRSTLILVCSCFICSHIIHIWADAVQYDKITALRTVFPAHYPMTAKSFLSNHGWLNEDNLYQSQNENYSLVKYPITNIKSEPDPTPQNILLLSLNGLSYSNLSIENTPNLLRFKQRAQSFDAHYLLYEDELDNVFSATYGLPLQYRKSVFSEQLLPVCTEEMLRQDYSARFFASANSQDKSAQKKYLANLTRSTGLRPNQIIEKVDDRQALKSAYQMIHKLHTEKQNFAVIVSLNDLKNYHDLSLLDYQDRIKRLLVLEAIYPVLAQKVELFKQDPTKFNSELTVKELLTADFASIMQDFEEKREEKFKQIKILVQQQIAYEQNLLKQEKLKSSDSKKQKKLDKDGSTNDFNFTQYHALANNNEVGGHDTLSRIITLDNSKPSIVFSSIVLKNQAEQYKLITEDYIKEVIAQSKCLQSSLANFSLDNYQAEYTNFEQDYIALHETFNEADPLLREISLYERSLKQSDALLGYALKVLEKNNILDNTLVIVTSFEGNSLLNNISTLYNRSKQHVPLFIAWPDKSQIGTNINEISSPQDINATIASEILKITTPEHYYTLGNSLKSLKERDFIIADHKEYLNLIRKEDNTFYLQDGASFVEKDGKKLQIKPNLEDLILSTRDLNRFLK